MNAEDLRSIAENLVPFGSDGRRHRLIESHDDWNAFLIGWAPGIHRGLHDHGESAGLYHVLQGVLFDARPPDVHNLKAVWAGGSGYIPPGVQHDVWSPSGLWSWGVHIYSPPLVVMNFYDERGAFIRSEGVDR
jgi:Cysteine dioxygenase type I